VQDLLFATLSFAGVCVYLRRFQIKQNVHKSMGGPIALSKVLWLGLCVYGWFFVPFVFVWAGPLAPPLWWTLVSFSVSMWVRGIAELLLLYKWKFWKPPMGITHDVVCFVQVFALLVWSALDGTRFNYLDWFAFAFSVWILISLVFEVKHASSFFHAILGKTVGDDGIWFADDDPKFQRILYWTRFGNWILIPSLVIILGGVLSEALFHR
jgi:hypothetical protein